MEREKQILSACQELKDKLGTQEHTFMCGVKWADAHPNWISVDDKLPEVCVDVLVYANNEILIAYLSHGHDWLYYEDVSSEDFPVEYWMELPQPPKNE